MSTNEQTVKVNDVIKCIKVLRKIKQNPQILNEPLFEPINKQLQQLNHISNLSPSELTTYMQQRKNKSINAKQEALAANDKRLKKESKIRIERQQRAHKSAQFRQFLQNKIIINDTETKTKEPSNNKQESKDERILNVPNLCYVCKTRYHKLHFFYDQLCKSCGDFNFTHRSDTMNCEGKIALITGCRTKVGYEIAVKLLNANCIVIGTTRFPKYAAIKFSKQKHFNIWKDKLFIFELDFCKMHSVANFIKHILNNYKHIDILINNAATTVRRTREFYHDVIEIEQNKILSGEQNKLMIEYEKIKEDNFNKYGNLLSLQCDINVNSKLYLKYEDNNIVHKVLKDIGGYDEFSQLVDLRNDNSWTQVIGTVQPMEALQAILVNQFVPFLLIKEFIPILCNDIDDKNKISFVVNASSIEGHFSSFKQGTHPHTNMAKAALNMFTRMYSKELVLKYNIFMVSVDIGWFSDDLPLTRRIKSNIWQRKRDKLEDDEYDIDDFVFHAPLDIVDAGARVLHPIWSGLRNDPYYGVYLKDYKPYGW
eukprot:6563_1